MPVIAEPSSAAWPGAVRTGPWLLGTPSLKPEQVVVAGRPTLHRAVARLLADPAVAVYALADERGLPWTDVAGSVRAVGALPPLRPDPEWLRRWAERRQGREPPPSTRRSTTARSGCSWPARWSPRSPTAPSSCSARPTRCATWRSPPLPRDGVVVRSNRGVAGIDGTISTAMGAALAHDGPTVALLGDLTLLHDTTGLVVGPDEPRPDLTIVVLDDRGGGIFHLLEQGAPEHAAAFERVFGTPHTVDLAALCAAMGVPARAEHEQDALRPRAGAAAGLLERERGAFLHGAVRRARWLLKLARRAPWLRGECARGGRVAATSLLVERGGSLRGRRHRAGRPVRGHAAAGQDVPHPAAPGRRDRGDDPAHAAHREPRGQRPGGHTPAGQRRRAGADRRCRRRDRRGARGGAGGPAAAVGRRWHALGHAWSAWRWR